MHTTLAQEAIVITGASAGIGEAIARKLAKKHAKLILIARRRDKLEALAQELDTDCFIITQDIRQTDTLVEQIYNAPEVFRPTVLINNAGLALGTEKAQDANIEDWDVMIDTNIRALVRLTRQLLPAMITKKHGYILQLGSVAGNWPYGGGQIYCGTKAFVRQFSLALRSDLLGTGVRVTNIEPGMVETEFSIVRLKGEVEKAKKLYEGFSPLTAEDIANTVVWCLEQPPHVNITTLEVMPTEQALAGFTLYREN